MAERSDSGRGGTALAGIMWTAAGTAAATFVFWALRRYLDKGQASLLYLLVVIASSTRFGFRAAVVGALLSFACWDFFLLPPYYTIIVSDPRDWIALGVFLITAVVTARLASQAKQQAIAAETREQETLALYQMSQEISSEVDASCLVPALAERVVALCDASRCVILRRQPDGDLVLGAFAPGIALTEEQLKAVAQVADEACRHDLIVGLGPGDALWARAMHDAHPESDTLGVFIPLRVKDALVGALHVGPRLDGRPFPAEDQRMILALANLAAVVIARQTLIEEAAQAAALREADALKEALLSMVTHELRTPLAAIKAASSGLRQGRAVWTESDAQDAIRTIDAEADRLATIVSNLLDLSRLEAGSWHPAKDWCDLADVAATALDRLPEEDAARVRLEFPDDLPLIRADYVQLALLLTNLLENAAKYAPRPSPIVVRVSPPPGPHPLGAAGGGLDGRGPEVGLLVTVRDYGPGITPGDEEKIFARFYRSARHEQGGVRGTGLGLALCRAIAEAHGGGIRAQNAAPGEPKGAVFTFEIPVE